MIYDGSNAMDLDLSIIIAKIIRMNLVFGEYENYINYLKKTICLQIFYKITQLCIIKSTLRNFFTLILIRLECSAFFNQNSLHVFVFTKISYTVLNIKYWYSHWFHFTSFLSFRILHYSDSWHHRVPVTYRNCAQHI